MHEYYENYFDLYWDLHLGVTGDAVAFVKELLRKVWTDGIELVTLDLDSPDRLPVGPATLIDDNITFTRAQRATPDR